jgi:hypothetical protein
MLCMSRTSAELTWPTPSYRNPIPSRAAQFFSRNGFDFGRRETLGEQIPRILHGAKRHLHDPFRFELLGVVEKVFENGGRYRD